MFNEKLFIAILLSTSPCFSSTVANDPAITDQSSFAIPSSLRETPVELENDAVPFADITERSFGLLDSTKGLSGSQVKVIIDTYPMDLVNSNDRNVFSEQVQALVTSNM